jgi:transcriptional regulator with XRE-family HTH domain
MGMNLRPYLDERKISVPEFARAIDVSTAALHRYLAGERIPRQEIMERIALATKGAVQPNDFFHFAKSNTPPASADAA